MSGRLSRILFPQRLTGLIRRRFTPPAVLDLRCVTDDPLYADYRHPQQDFVVNVPLARCRASFRADPA